MKIIIFTYYFPPDNSVGVRRITYWIDFLIQKKINVILFTISRDNVPSYYLNNEYLEIREVNFWNVRTKSKNSIANENIRTQTKDINPGYINRLLKFVKVNVINKYLGQLFDPRFFYVIPIIIHFIKNKKKYADVNAVLSTAPPIFVHFWAVIFKRVTKLPIILDYRDQFSNNPMFSSKLSYFERKLDKYLITQSDIVLVVSDPIKKYYQKLKQKNIVTILNGYDERIFTKESSLVQKKSYKKFTYVGSITHKSRIPNNFLKWLDTVDFGFKFYIYGNASLLQKYVTQNHSKISSNIIFKKGINYSKVPEILRNSDFNLVFEEKNPTSESQFGTIPTKVFEYIAVGVPIISEMSEKVMAMELLTESNLLVHNFIDNNFLNIKINTYKVNKDLQKKLSRENGAKKLLQIIKDLND